MRTTTTATITAKKKNPSKIIHMDLFPATHICVRRIVCHNTQQVMHAVSTHARMHAHIFIQALLFSFFQIASILLTSCCFVTVEFLKRKIFRWSITYANGKSSKAKYFTLSRLCLLLMRCRIHSFFLYLFWVCFSVAVQNYFKLTDFYWGYKTIHKKSHILSKCQENLVVLTHYFKECLLLCVCLRCMCVCVCR